MSFLFFMKHVQIIHAEHKQIKKNRNNVYIRMYKIIGAIAPIVQWSGLNQEGGLGGAVAPGR